MVYISMMNLNSWKMKITHLMNNKLLSDWLLSCYNSIKEVMSYMTDFTLNPKYPLTLEQNEAVDFMVKRVA